MITALQLGVAVYLGGCVPAFVFFLIGRAPALLERNWPWPVIFLWPLLLFWPLRFVFHLLPDGKRSRQDQRAVATWKCARIIVYVGGRRSDEPA